MEECLNCGNAELDPLYRAPAFDSALGASSTKDFPVVRCRNCDLVTTAGVSSDILTTAYSIDYYGSETSKFATLIESAIVWQARRRAAALVQTWRAQHKPTDSPRVLDIGCGRGVMLRAFQDSGASIQGLERPEFQIDDSIRDYVRHGSIFDEALDAERYDIIIIWHVLEHIEQPDALIREVIRHLSEGGLLIVAVPDFSSNQQRLFGKHWFHLDIPRHLIHFEQDWLTQCFKRNGLVIEATGSIDLLQNIYGFVQSLLNKLLPEHQNELYELLKSNHRQGSALKGLLWLLAAGITLPLALMELVISYLMNRNATLIVSARQPAGGQRKKPEL